MHTVQRTALIATTGLVALLVGCVPLRPGAAPAGTPRCTNPAIGAPRGEKAYPLPCELLTRGPVLARTVGLPNRPINVAPPADGVKPGVTSAAAMSAAKKTAAYPRSSTASPAVKLGVLFDNDTRGATAQGFVPVFYDRLVWVVSFSNVPDEYPSGGGVGPSGTTASGTAAGRVNLVIFIDAATGKYLKAIDDTVDQPV